MAECGWWVWGGDDDVCVCGLEPGHRGRHRCRCGAFWKGLGYPPPPPENVVLAEFDRNRAR